MEKKVISPGRFPGRARMSGSVQCDGSRVSHSHATAPIHRGLSGKGPYFQWKMVLGNI